MRRFLAAIGFLALAGCAERPAREAEGSGSRAGGESTPTTGMHMDMPSMGMMTTMRAHMDSMRTASPERMKAMMAAHQEMASRMMDAMGSDMRMMGMAGDSAWAALSDSVRRDLAELPDLTGQELSTRMRAHAERMQRLMAQHEVMMGSMK
jgi:hypothetical protein